MSPSEIEPAKLLERSGAKLQTAPIPSNEFIISVVGIDFTDVPIGDAALAPAADLPYLRTLVLRGAKVTDAGLSTFRKTQNLETVDLGKTLIRGEGLRELRYHAVRNLNLAGAPISDAGMENLAEMGHHLSRLCLASTQITDEGIARLETLRGLEELDLSQTKCTGLVLRLLPTGIRQLNLSGTAVTDARLSSLEHLGRLEHLDLSGTQITDAALAQIRAEVRAARVHHRNAAARAAERDQVPPQEPLRYGTAADAPALIKQIPGRGEQRQRRRLP